MVLGQVATDHRNLGAGRETVDLQRFPDDLVQVDVTDPNQQLTRTLRSPFGCDKL